jgi:SAM-dependent methyltransferase
MLLAEIPDLSLSECLAIVRKHFDAAHIAGQKIDHASVLDYFQQSRRGYRLFHSKEGAMHVALNRDAEFTTEGYLGQVDLIEARLKRLEAERVLEIGCGVGYNVRHLARRMPECRFTGLDLAEEHVQTARREAGPLENLQFQQGNFQSLSFDPGSFDAEFAVECLCQASDMRAALGEAARVLRPGGQLIVIDCFRAQDFSALDSNMQLAVQLVEKTMAVDKFWSLARWKDVAVEEGLTTIESVDLSEEISHNVARFYSLSRRFFKMPRAARAFLKAFPPRLLQNAISGLLMPFTVASGAHRYQLCVLERNG